MATAIGTVTRTNAQTREVLEITWLLTTANADGSYEQVPEYGDKTVHAFGTFGAGTLTLEGSNEPAVPTAPIGLKDLQDTAIALTANGMKTIQENPRQIRPLLTGSTGATVTVIMTIRGRV